MNKTKHTKAKQLEYAKRAMRIYHGTVSLYGRKQATTKACRVISPMNFKELAGIKASVTLYNRIK